MVRRGQLRPTINVNISQRLAMTPSLLQKIELLTLNHLELSELLNQELSENPVLEEAPELSDAEVAEKNREKESKDKKDKEEKEKEVEEKAADDEFDFEYFFDEYLNTGSRTREYESNDERPSFELFLASSSSLIDHLNWQLNLAEAPDSIREIAYYVIGNVNEDGYLKSSLEEMAQNLDVEAAMVEEALKLVQGMDPVGVGARDLQECLLLQLAALGKEDSLEARLVREFLPQLEAKKFKEIGKELDCSLEDIQEAMETIRTLSPKPGEKFGSKEPVYIQPDIYIYKVEDDFQIVMNDDGMPRLRLSPSYRELLKGNSISKETRSYIKERFRSAVELLKSIDQRQQTIYRVCTAIVNRQREFLDHGFMQLKPMLIKDVAEELEVHSSTISRVVANKYAYTPQGVIELRKFFTVGIESADGESLSIVQVKGKIRSIIEGEPSSKPLSDQEITNVLNQEGINITRRTVAKYRDQMNIPGSRERKRAL